jgi:hypothetical protein
MVDILFAGGQIVCMAGYVYGAWLVIRHAGSIGSPPPDTREYCPPRPNREDREAWKRYLACDV